MQKRFLFTKAELENDSPSRADGIDPLRELNYRQQAATLIQDMGQRLKLTQLPINTAIVYMHRFFAIHSMRSVNRHELALAALFLAAKTEEQPRPIAHCVTVYHVCVFKTNVTNDSEDFLRTKDALIDLEQDLLQTIGFDLVIEHPHAHVVRCTQMIKASKELAQTSYFMATNSLHLTTFCLQHRPTAVACVCIYLACKWSSYEIPPSNQGSHWYEYIDSTVTESDLEELVQEFLLILDKSPSRIKRKLSSQAKGAASNLEAPPPMFGSSASRAAAASGSSRPPSSGSSRPSESQKRPSASSRDQQPDAKRVCASSAVPSAPRPGGTATAQPSSSLRPPGLSSSKPPPRPSSVAGSAASSSSVSSAATCHAAKSAWSSGSLVAAAPSSLGHTSHTSASAPASAPGHRHHPHSHSSRPHNGSSSSSSASGRPSSVMSSAASSSQASSSTASGSSAGHHHAHAHARSQAPPPKPISSSSHSNSHRSSPLKSAGVGGSSSGGNSSLSRIKPGAPPPAHARSTLPAHPRMPQLAPPPSLPPMPPTSTAIASNAKTVHTSSMASGHASAAPPLPLGAPPDPEAPPLPPLPPSNGRPPPPPAPAPGSGSPDWLSGAKDFSKYSPQELAQMQSQLEQKIKQTEASNSVIQAEIARSGQSQRADRPDRRSYSSSNQ